MQKSSGTSWPNAIKLQRNGVFSSWNHQWVCVYACHGCVYASFACSQANKNHYIFSAWRELDAHTTKRNIRETFSNKWTYNEEIHVYRSDGRKVRKSLERERENVPIQKRGREKETKVSPSEQNQQQQQFDLYADNGFGEKSVSRPAWVWEAQPHLHTHKQCIHVRHERCMDYGMFGLFFSSSSWACECMFECAFSIAFTLSTYINSTRVCTSHQTAIRTHTHDTYMYGHTRARDV